MSVEVEYSMTYLIDQAYTTPKSKKAGVKKCAYFLDEYPKIVLLESKIPQDDLERIKLTLATLADSGVNVPRILDTQYLNDENRTSFYTMQKAKGVELWSKQSKNPEHYALINELMTIAPQEHYDKLANDLQNILQVGFTIDVNKHNFFYDPQFGFSFIDLDNFSKRTIMPDDYSPKNILEIMLELTIPFQGSGESIFNDPTDKQQIDIARVLLKNVSSAVKLGAINQEIAATLSQTNLFSFCAGIPEIRKEFNDLNYQKLISLTFKEKVKNDINIATDNLSNIFYRDNTIVEVVTPLLSEVREYITQNSNSKDEILEYLYGLKGALVQREQEAQKTISFVFSEEDERDFIDSLEEINQEIFELAKGIQPAQTGQTDAEQAADKDIDDVNDIFDNADLTPPHDITHDGNSMALVSGGDKKEEIIEKEGYDYYSGYGL